MKSFKYIILSKKRIKTHEKFLPYFLGNDEEEAHKVYNAFSKLLDTISGNYSMSTGLERLDIFEEALVGLARAVRDFDPRRSSDFKTYAIYRIKDAIRKYVRKFKSVISAPAYLESAKRHLNNIKGGCTESALFLENAAQRAGLTIEELIERTEMLPSEVELDDNVEDTSTEEAVYAALLIQKLKEHMEDDELLICDMIVEGRTYEEIGNVFDKGPTWVVYKLGKLRERLVKKGLWEK